MPNDRDPPGVQALSASRHGSAGAKDKGENQDKDEGKDKGAEILGSHSEIKVLSSVSTHANPLAAGSSTSIPWTIVNKYYTADVHFETHEFEQFRVHHAIGVPAIIYVWGPGEVSALSFATVRLSLALMVSTLLHAE